MRKCCLLTVAVALVSFPGASPRLGATARSDAAALRTMRYTPRSAEAAARWQGGVRSELARRLKIDDLVRQRDTLALAPRVRRSPPHNGYTLFAISIVSTPGRRLKAVVTVPTDVPAPMPAVVCIGGHGSTRYSPYAAESVPADATAPADRIYKGFATVLAQRGYVTISTTVSQHTAYEADRLLMGERLWDLMRCVDYLASRPDVDPARIGAAGLSLGGEMAMWLAAMDERIAATVSAGFLTTMDHLEQNHCLCWKFDGLRALVDFSDLYALLAPRPLQCQNGLREPASQFYVPLARQALAEVRTIYTDLGRPENVVLDVHAGGHEIDLPALVYFFEKHLQHNRWIGK